MYKSFCRANTSSGIASLLPGNAYVRLDNDQVSTKGAILIIIPIINGWEFPLSSNLTGDLDVDRFVNFCHSGEFKIVFIMMLICIYWWLIKLGIFSSIYGHLYFLFYEISIKSFCLFFFWVSLSFWFGGVLSIFWILIVSHMCFWYIFSFKLSFYSFQRIFLMDRSSYFKTFILKYFQT